MLSYFKWYRLILDEGSAFQVSCIIVPSSDTDRPAAHVIRNRSTKKYKAMADLSASIRWCITGTPIQNSLRDLGSLVEFLRVPFLGRASDFRKHIEKSRKTLKGTAQPDYGNLKIAPWIDMSKVLHLYYSEDAGRRVQHAPPILLQDRKKALRQPGY